MQGLKVNQKSEKIKISNELLSNAIDAIARKAENASFRCFMEMENLFFTAVKFGKKDDVKKQKFTCNNKKVEEKTIEFYDYFDHLKKHGFKWQNGLISYEIKITLD